MINRVPIGDWGSDDEPALSAPRGANWVEAPDAPAWAFLPAVWPASHRTSMADVAPRLVEEYSLDSEWAIQSRATSPWSTADSETFDAETDSQLQSVGLPPRPRGRRWFLQLPPGVESLDQLLDQLVSRGEARGIAFSLSVEFVSFVARDLPTHYRWA